MVGLIEDIDCMVTSYFKNEGDIIALIGNAECSNSIGGSEYLKQQFNLVKGDAPEIDLNMESNLIDALVELAKAKSINSAHDVSDGGLAVNIAESCLIKRTLPIGCTVNIEYKGRPDFYLFNESHGRAVISFDKKSEEIVKKICKKNNIEFSIIGKTGGNSVIINKEVNIPLDIAKDAYYNSISKIMEN